MAAWVYITLSTSETIPKMYTYVFHESWFVPFTADSEDHVVI